MSDRTLENCCDLLLDGTFSITFSHFAHLAGAGQ